MQDMLTAILGGAGRDPGGHGTAVSRATSAHFRLRAVDESTCINEFRWTYDFSEVRDNHKFVVLATDDPNTAGIIARERIYPLFELWLLAEDALEDFVPTLREQTRVGITYRDDGGVIRTLDPTVLRGEEVAFKDHSAYVRLPTTVRRDSVQIVEFDLHDLADPDHVFRVYRDAVVADHLPIPGRPGLCELVSSASLLRRRGHLRRRGSRICRSDAGFPLAPVHPEESGPTYLEGERRCRAAASKSL